MRAPGASGWQAAALPQLCLAVLAMSHRIAAGHISEKRCRSAQANGPEAHIRTAEEQKSGYGDSPHGVIRPQNCSDCTRDGAMAADRASGSSAAPDPVRASGNRRLPTSASTTNAAGIRFSTRALRARCSGFGTSPVEDVRQSGQPRRLEGLPGEDIHAPAAASSRPMPAARLLPRNQTHFAGKYSSGFTGLPLRRISKCSIWRLDPPISAMDWPALTVSPSLTRRLRLWP